MIALFLVIVIIMSLAIGNVYCDDELITCICTLIFITAYLVLFAHLSCCYELGVV